jgi:hypothetical protein
MHGQQNIKCGIRCSSNIYCYFIILVKIKKTMDILHEVAHDIAGNSIVARA